MTGVRHYRMQGHASLGAQWFTWVSVCVCVGGGGGGGVGGNVQHGCVVHAG